MFSVIRKVILFLFQFTSAGRYREVKKVIRNSDVYSRCDLGNAEKYCKDNIVMDGSSRVERVVLVDMLYSHPATNFYICLTQMFLGKKYLTDVLALTEFGDVSEVKTIAKAFGIARFVGIYKWFDFKNHIKALFGAVYYKVTAGYDINNGISLRIDGQEIGDLVYDEYLRLTGKPTTSRIDFLYMAVIYNSLYRYYRYKEIVKINGVTDIVMSHDVYAKFGLVFKAAAAVSNNVLIWVPFGTKPMCIGWHKANKEAIKKNQEYKKSYGEEIRRAKTIEEIEEEFNKALDMRLTVTNSARWDLNYVNSNNEIVSVDAFKNNYKIDGKNIFVMAHVFVDAVRYPLWQTYSDNYTWLRETLRLLAKRSRKEDIFVKPHPSEIHYPDCKISVKEVVDEINRLYDARFIYLDKKIHNGVIFKLAKAIITSHGSVGIEAPCFGIPVITSSFCQYQESGSVFQGKNAMEYQALLDGIDLLPKLTEEQILSARIAFLWFNVYAYADSEILPNLEVNTCKSIEQEYKKINDVFKSAKNIEQQKVFEVFSAMIDKGNNDFLNL